MEINIECPKCNHTFKKNIDEINTKFASKITEKEREEIREEGKKQGLKEGEEGRKKDREKYKKEIEKVSRVAQSSVKKSEKLSIPDKGKIAEKLLEEYLNSKFPDYPTEQILSGKAGGDIIMSIKENNELMGSIYFESKYGYDNFQGEWVDKLKQDMLRDNANYGVIVSTVLPASHNSDEPYIKYKDGLIYAVETDKKPNIYSIVDRLADRIKREYRLKKIDEKRMHNLTDNEKNAVSFIKSENPQLLIDLHNEIKKSEDDLDSIGTSHTKTQTLLKKQIKQKRATFKDFYEKLDLLDIDLGKVDDVIEKNKS